MRSRTVPHRRHALRVLTLAAHVLWLTVAAWLIYAVFFAAPADPAPVWSTTPLSPEEVRRAGETLLPR